MCVCVCVCTLNSRLYLDVFEMNQLIKVRHPHSLLLQKLYWDSNPGPIVIELEKILKDLGIPFSIISNKISKFMISIYDNYDMS